MIKLSEQTLLQTYDIEAFCNRINEIDRKKNL